MAEGFRNGLVVPEGLAAHGRGEAFDYLLGEKTTLWAERAVEAAAAALLLAKSPVISVNGNVAALVPRETVELAKIVNAKLEINLFHGSKAREKKIASWLRKNGAKEVFGTDPKSWKKIEEINSNRRKVDRCGIASADVVLVPLEDGDRTEALKRLGKIVITIDLNPMSRTARAADITIIDNITRAMPRLVKKSKSLSKTNRVKLHRIVKDFNNEANLKNSLGIIFNRLKHLKV